MIIHHEDTKKTANVNHRDTESTEKKQLITSCLIVKKLIKNKK